MTTTNSIVWTKEMIAARRAEGDAIVTADGWGVSTTTGSGIDGARLSCVRFEPHTYRVLERDARDGEVFPSTEDAEVYTLNAGRSRWYSDYRALRAAAEGRP